MKKLSKLQKIVNLLIQLGIFLATCMFIYRQVFYKNELTRLTGTLEHTMLNPDFQAGLLLVLAMMILNWGIEAYKWKYLIGKVEKVSFFKAYQAVLTGISVSSFIPNRVGEFFGRVFILKTASRIESILITVVGSMSQLLVTVLAGSVALLVFIPQYLPGAGFSSGHLYFGIFMLVITLDAIILGLFFKLSFLSVLKERILQNGLKRLRKFFRVFAFYHNREMATVIFLSFSRYMVFSTQFYILLLLFGIRIPYDDALVLIALVYFIMTIIPTIALTELGIRGSVTLYVFGLYYGRLIPAAATNTMGIFAASTLLWMINLGIPALAGTLFVFRLKFFRKPHES
jgi:hypothetical protein